jgi:outer membrane protein OmpA-like peptidoglycan-associated protein
MRKFYYIFLVLFIIKNGTAQSVDTIYEQVYFDFDKYDLTTSEQNKLDAITLKGTLLQVYIEANTDARGSNDYNLRLGANRASTVSDYLNTKGIQPEVLKIINHGEARPIAFKEEETAFAKNRRVDIIIIYHSSRYSRNSAPCYPPRYQ